MKHLEIELVYSERNGEEVPTFRIYLYDLGETDLMIVFDYEGEMVLVATMKKEHTVIDPQVHYEHGGWRHWTRYFCVYFREDYRHQPHKLEA